MVRQWIPDMETENVMTELLMPSLFTMVVMVCLAYMATVVLIPQPAQALYEVVAAFAA